MTECPVIMRLKSFPAQFGSLLICSFMVGPGQSQHEQAALLYLGLEVSEGEGIKTKCEEGREGGRSVTPPSNKYLSHCPLLPSPAGSVESLTSHQTGWLGCVKPISNCCNAMVMLVCRGGGWRGGLQLDPLISARLRQSRI